MDSQATGEGQVPIAKRESDNSNLRDCQGWYNGYCVTNFLTLVKFDF